MKKSKAKWSSDESLSAWERIKAAFANDWEQTKKDFGSTSARNLHQDVDDTVKQAFGSRDAFENHEQAFRFGYAARRHFQSQYPDWNDELEDHLKTDYEGDFNMDRDFIRHAYQYRERA